MISELSKVQIHPTHQCNLRCIFCDVPDRSVGRRDLEDSEWMQIVNGLCKLRPKMVTISGGGEPLLRASLLTEIMKTLHSSDIGIELITNGTIISDGMAKTITECCDHYRVSLHATTRELDELLRGVRGSVNLSFEGIKKIVSWKKKMGRVKPKIDIAMVLTQFNVGEVEKMIEMGHSLGVNMISLRIVHKCGEKYRPSDEQIGFLKKNLDKYEAMATKYNLELQYDFIPKDVFSTPEDDPVKNEPQDQNPVLCTLPFREMVIFADGRVAPCCNFIVEYDDFVNLASVKNKSIDEIWFGKKFDTLRKRMLEGENRLPEKCKECSLDLKPIDQAYKV